MRASTCKLDCRRSMLPHTASMRSAADRSTRIVSSIYRHSWPAPAKYTEVMSVIKRRIREGDYLLDSIPGERKIAEETGVSYMTARRAVQELLDEEVLIRDPSGSLDVHPRLHEARQAGRSRAALPGVSVELSHAAAQRGLRFRQASAASGCVRRSSSIGTRRRWSKRSSRRRARSSFPMDRRFPPGWSSRFRRTRS